MALWSQLLEHVKCVRHSFLTRWEMTVRGSHRLSYVCPERSHASPIPVHQKRSPGSSKVGRLQPRLPDTAFSLYATLEPL